MIVYKFDIDTKHFTGSHTCQNNPLGNGYLYPANYTEIAPDDTLGKMPVWSGTKWNYIDDMRGKVIYNKTTLERITLEKIDSVISADYTDKAPDVEYPRWSGTKWIVDTAKKDAAEAKQKKERMLYLQARISAGTLLHIDMTEETTELAELNK
jgi:hypothetical protein